MTKRRWRNPDKRMAAAVNLRREGYSLRQIGAELDVDARTVRRDLSRWESEQVEALLRQSGASAGQCPSEMPQRGGVQ